MPKRMTSHVLYSIPVLSSFFRPFMKDLEAAGAAPEVLKKIEDRVQEEEAKASPQLLAKRKAGWETYQRAKRRMN